MSLPIRSAAIPSSLRATNRLTIFELLRLEGTLSRAEISRRTGISVPTVSSVIGFFIEKDIALVVGEGKGRLGRKPILIRLNPDAAFSVGVDLGGNSINIGVVNLAGKVKGEISCPCAREFITSDELTVIPSSIENLLTGLRLPPERIIGVGIGMPGVTDPTTGAVRLAPQLGSGALEERLGNLKEILQERVGFPVCMENDVNAAALGEQRARNRDSPPHFAFVSVGAGIGAGLIVNGQLYRGSHYAAGEIGYMIVNDSHDRNAHGDFGSLERIASCPAIIARAKSLGWVSTVPEGGSNKLAEEIQQLGQDAAAAVGPARKALEGAAEHLSSALANTIALYDPALVVLGGIILQAGAWFVACLSEKLGRLSPLPVPVEPSRSGSQAGLVGAAAVASVANLSRLLAG